MGTEFVSDRFWFFYENLSQKTCDKETYKMFEGKKGFNALSKQKRKILN